MKKCVAVSILMVLVIVFTILMILGISGISGCVSKGSGNVSQEEIGVDIPVHINIVTIEEHKYIVVDNKRSQYGGGVAIIHAESCQCKK